MVSRAELGPTYHSPPAFGWASIVVGVIAFLLFPAPGQMGFRYEDVALTSTVAAVIAAVGVGLGLRALRRRTRPLWAAAVGLLGNAGIVVVTAARLIAWL